MIGFLLYCVPFAFLSVLYFFKVDGFCYRINTDENPRPRSRRSRSEGDIDGISALIHGLNMDMFDRDPPPRYEPPPNYEDVAYLTTEPDCDPPAYEDIVNLPRQRRKSSPNLARESSAEIRTPT